MTQQNAIADTMMQSGYTFQQELLLQALEREVKTGMLMTNPRVTGFTSFAKAVLNFIDDKKAPRTKKNLYNYLVANGYYIDSFYQWTIDRIVLVFANMVALFDRIVVNDTVVNGTGYSVFLSAFKLRYLETGKLYNYALAMVIGVLFIGISKYWGIL